MPFCEREGINYFNPQVDNWSKPLEKVEAYAKQEAGILLFVIDKETYALASMVEAAEYIGAGREVVLVMHEIQDAGAITNGRTGDREMTGEYTEGIAVNHVRRTLSGMCRDSAHCTLFDQTYTPHLSTQGTTYVPVNDALAESLNHIEHTIKGATESSETNAQTQDEAGKRKASWESVAEFDVAKLMLPKLHPG